MSPSRGLLASTTSCTAALRCSTGSQSARSFRPIFAASQSRAQLTPRRPNASYSSVSFDLNPRPIPQQRQYGHDDAHSYEIDSTLFEEEDEQYREGRALAPDSQAVHPDLFKNDSVQAMLLSLLQAERYADATNALREMQSLATPIEPHVTFAEAALYCAEQGDMSSSVTWLQVVPSRAQLEKPGEDAGAALRPLTDTLAKVLQHFVVALDAERVWNMLLWLARQHYFAIAERDSNLPHRMANSLSWLMQHQYSVRAPSHPQSFSTWSVRFWHAFTSLAMRADIEFHMDAEKMSYQDAKTVRMTLWMSRVPHMPDPLCLALERLYNNCIRSLCRARRYDAVFAWLRVSDIFDPRFSSREAMPLAYSSSQVPSGEQEWYPANTANILLTSTWAFVFDRVYRGGSTTVSEAQTEVDTLIDDLGKQISKLKKELRRVRSRKSRAANVLRRSRMMLYAARDILSEPPDEWIPEHTSIMMGRFRDVQITVTDHLKASEPMQGLQHYFRHVRDAQLLALAQRILPPPEFEDVRAAYEYAPLDQIFSNTTMSVFGLRCLLHHLRRDPDRLAELYSLWLSSVAQFQIVLTPDPNVSPSLSEFGQLSADVFEVPGDASNSAIRPSEAHFGAFMRTVPRALTQVGRKWATNQLHQTLISGDYDADADDMDDFDDGETGEEPPLGEEKQDASSSYGANAHLEACRWAAQILTDMQRFNMQPDIRMLNWLLDTVARNVDLPPIDRGRLLPCDFDPDHEQPDELAPELDAVWRIAKALGMGPSSLEKVEEDYEPVPSTMSEALEMASARRGKPRADPVTYAFLMRGLIAISPQRGGPLLHEARMVQRWLDADEYAQEMLKVRPEQYETMIKLTYQILDDSEESARRSRERYLEQAGVHSAEPDVNESHHRLDQEAAHFKGVAKG